MVRKHRYVVGWPLTLALVHPASSQPIGEAPTHPLYLLKVRSEGGL